MEKFAFEKRFIIWLNGEDGRYFRSLETQINETLSLGLCSLIWVLPNINIDYYSGFCALVRSKLVTMHKTSSS